MRYTHNTEQYIYAGVGVTFLIVGIAQPTYSTIVLAGALLLVIASYKKGKADALKKKEEKKRIYKEIKKSEDTDLRVN